MTVGTRAGTAPTAFEVVTFLSDFGLDDVFVGVCHGVLTGRAPHARIIDLTHAVPPGDVRRGARLLARSVPHVPSAVHLAVVDPGVGTSRRGIAIAAARGDLLVGPDNGLLIDAAEELGGIVAAHELTAVTDQPAVVSATFHGRDVFAPAAAALACGTPISDLGPGVDDLAASPPEFLEVDLDRALMVCEAVLIDRFGNVQLAARPADAARIGLQVGAQVVVGGHGGRTVPYVRTFGDVAGDTLGLYEDSDGRLALAVNGGSAAEVLDVEEGDRLTLLPASAA